MTEAVRLRAQKAYSTDPEYLERMAVHEEARDEHMPPKRTEWAPAAERTATQADPGQHQ